MIILMAVAFAATHSTEVDFEGVDITATPVRSEISLIQQYTPQLCPNIDPSTDEWVECVSNIDYFDYKKICDSLGPDTKEFVSKLKARHIDRFDGKSEKSIVWNGCLYNSIRGASTQSFDFIFANNSWFMTDHSHELYAVSSHDTKYGLNDVDLEKQPSEESYTLTRLLTSHITIAYVLNPLLPDVWVATTSQKSMLTINDHLKTQNIAPIYCSEIWNTEDCIHLTRLAIQRVGINMLTVSSVPDKDHRGGFVSGILWRSTGIVDSANTFDEE